MSTVVTANKYSSTGTGQRNYTTEDDIAYS